jgi:PTS system ascorbate-specific IIB component
MMLRMQVDKVAKELGINAIVENTDLTSAKADRPDAIFTSNELAPELRSAVSVPVIAISRYTDRAEIKAALEGFLANR